MTSSVTRPVSLLDIVSTIAPNFGFQNGNMGYQYTQGWRHHVKSAMEMQKGNSTLGPVYIIFIF